MAARDIIVIGASAGGVEALSQTVRGLPAGFPASLFIVCHFPAGGRSVLPEILSRSGPLLASHPADGDRFYPGQIYVAPPDRHLLLAPDRRMRLSRGARENHHRPAVDPLFRSAARYYGTRVIGVVLTGALHDGAAGLMAIRSAGGLAVVQDPHDALIAAMPQNAANFAGVDAMIKVGELADLLVSLVQEAEGSDQGAKPMGPLDRMSAIVDQDMTDRAEVRLAEQNEAREAALWTPVGPSRKNGPWPASRPTTNGPAETSMPPLGSRNRPTKRHGSAT